MNRSKQGSLLVSLPISGNRSTDISTFFPEATVTNLDGEMDVVADSRLEEKYVATEKERRQQNSSFMSKKRTMPEFTKLEFDAQVQKEEIVSEITRLQKKLAALCPPVVDNAVQEMGRRVRCHRILSKLECNTTDDPLDNLDQLCCWWCTEPFHGKIVHHPLRYLSGGRKQTFETHGCFCGFSCMLAFDDATSRSIGHTRPLVFDYISKVSTNISFTQASGLKLAPSRFILLKFGGTLTIEEFRSKSNDANIRFQNTTNQMVTDTVIERNNNPTPSVGGYRVSRSGKRSLPTTSSLLKMIK